MRKVKIGSLLFVSVFVLFTTVIGIQYAKASVVACPVGYVCTPVSQSAVACPTGYVCTPIMATPVQPVITSATYTKEDGTEVKWCYSLTKNLGEVGGEVGYSSTGADVVALQTKLIDLGYDIPSVMSGGSVKGQFDRDTKNAVMKYQASKGISTTGFVGPLTRASLNASCKTKPVAISTSSQVKAYYDKSAEKIYINWQKYAGDFDYYQLFLGNSVLNKEVHINNSNIAKDITEYSTGLPSVFFEFSKTLANGWDSFYVKVNVIKNDSIGGNSQTAGKSVNFGISPNSSPTPSPTPTNTPSSNCPAGFVCAYPTVSPSPSPVQSPGQPSVSFIYPRGSETWNVGDTKNVSWAYSNFNTTVTGDKFVELQLLPQDGRAPVVLGTYTYPYSYQPLNIYTKTTTGREAWLPGQYKLRLACKSTNIDGFRSCAETVPGYITVPPTPSPTPSSGAIMMQNPDNKELNASIWSAIEEYNRTR